MKTFLTFLCCFFTVAFSLPAQTLLEGYVRDMECCGISEAVVTVMCPDTREVIYSTQTDTTGVFVLADVPRHFLLDVASFGYKPYTCALDVDSCMGNPLHITLEYISLDEVTVTADGKPRMVRSGNKVLIDKLGNSPHAQGSDMYTFMKFIPVLNVPMFSGEVTLRETGKNAVLLVNGKPVHIPMDVYLKNIHVENVECIEVVANPMGEYKVNGTDGVINLILKKREDEGIQCNLSLNDTQYGGNSQGGTFSVSYTRNKAFITSGINVGNSHFKFEKKVDYLYEDTGRRMLEESDMNNRSQNFSGYFNFDYEASKRHTVGVQVSAGGYRQDDESLILSTYSGYGSVQVDSSYRSASNVYTPDKFSYLSGNLNYTFRIDDKGSMFYADADYRMTRPNAYTHHVYDRTDVGGNADRTDNLQKVKTCIDTYGVWLRYIKVFNPGTRLVSGLSYYASGTRYDYVYESLEDGGYVNVFGQSNRFYLDDRTLSANASLHHSWSNHLDMSVELAVHFYGAEGEQEMTGESFSRNEVNVLPAFRLAYDPNENHALSLNLMSMVFRPNYFDLNPFRTYLSVTSYRQGNPELKSARVYSTGINYTFFKDYSLNASVDCWRDNQAFLTLPDGEGFIRTMPVNRGSSCFVNWGLDIDKTLFHNRLNLSYSVEGNFVRFKNDLSYMDRIQDSFSWETDFRAMALMNRQWTFIAGYGYSSHAMSDSNTQPDRHMVDLMLMKRFRHSNLSIGLRKFFRKNDKDVYYEQPGYSYHTFMKQYWLAYASFSVTFGNSRTKTVIDRSNAEVKSRTSRPVK